MTQEIYDDITEQQTVAGDSQNSPDKVLVANRGEIAIRVFRSAHELQLKTIGIFSSYDHLSMHRFKADEAFMIGEPEQYSAVGAYLAMDEILNIAIQHGARAIHPGYGFLAENPTFAKKCLDNNIEFIGPSPDVISKCGDKTLARQLAIEAGVPVVPGTDGPVDSLQKGLDFTAKHGFPVIIKAALGGGGRGMRVVHRESDFEDSFKRAQSEALSAFGDGTVFLERFLDKPRHIEVQLLGDKYGNIVHFFERDCSVQRRYQKVVEIAPSLTLEKNVRESILNDALKLARHVGYYNAGTAEFLVDEQNRHYFIEINPRIQVEHTVTETITGFDLVTSQIQIALGKSLPELGISQEKIIPRGFAIQCRVTTEDPEENFRPDTGKIVIYRSAGGQGVRLDGGPGYAGAVVSPYYDSLLVKLTCSGLTYEMARQKSIRALKEFRVQGVKTNLPFILNVLNHPTFIAGKVWTTFIDDTPSLFDFMKVRDRAYDMLSYMGNAIVNGSMIMGQHGAPGLNRTIIPPPLPLVEDYKQPCQLGWRNILLEQGPAAFAKAIRNHPGCLIMDTTWRDAHQSLLATRLRTIDIEKIATRTSHALQNAYSIEMWGGATFDVALRFLYENPWDRLKKLRKLCPNIPFQMLLRGANAVGYTSYPDNVVYEFCRLAFKNGIDIFRVFDSLNDMENLKLGIDAVKKAGGVVEAVVCYTGDLTSSKPTKYTLEYYLGLVDQLVEYGIHVLSIKDMAGLLKPRSAKMLVGGIREKYPDLPIHVHTHDTPGMGVAAMIAAAEAGADVVDVAIDSMSGMTSQPSMGAVVTGLGDSTGIDFRQMQSLNSYWEQVRLLYSCFDADLKSSDSSVYDHEMPGGQYTNLLFQAHSLGLGTQWEDIKVSYAAANRLCGDIVKVTPSSKVVGDLAQFMVSNSLSEEDVRKKAKTLSFPKSVVEYFQGCIGEPYGGFPEPLRSDILKNLPPIKGRPGASMEPLDLIGLKKSLMKKYGAGISDEDVITSALYPAVFADYQKFISQYGDLSMIETRYFLGSIPFNEDIRVDFAKGKTLFIKYIGTGHLDGDNGTRDVFFELNGESRVVPIVDHSAPITAVMREKADSNNITHVGAPMSGAIIEVYVKEGCEVKVGEPICVLSAMKMEMVVTANVCGRLEHLTITKGDNVSSGDLLGVVKVY